MGQSGVFAMPVSNKYGGGDKSFQHIAQSMIELGESNNDNGLMLAAGAHIWAGIMPIQLFGSEKQKKMLFASSYHW